MTENKKTPQDVRVHGELYPTNILIEMPVTSLKTNDKNTLIFSDKAIQLSVKIDSPTYQKKIIKEAINQACLKLLEYFC